jgi:signal transduction histidine kinase
LQDSKTKLSGFNLGGVDYISKPFQREELLARVKTHLTIREQKLRLQDYNDRLETMVEERTAQLVHADRLATLGTLVAAVAHEINNPLQAVVGNVELALLELDELKENPDPSSSQTGQNFVEDQTDHIGHNLQEIKRGAQKMREIINTLKNFGKRGTSRKEFFPIILPIQEVLGIMRAKLKTSVTVNLQIPQGLVCYGNKQQFSQIFINLIHNAVDALAGREGTLFISAESDEARQVIIDVKDSGQGIPEDLFDSIFDPFFTTKNESEGTGLGLFITRQIIEQHHGSIHPVPHQGAGAWFRITLPNPD